MVGERCWGKNLGGSCGGEKEGSRGGDRAVGVIEEDRTRSELRNTGKEKCLGMVTGH